MCLNKTNAQNINIVYDELPEEADLFGITTPGVWFWRHSGGYWNLGNNQYLSEKDMKKAFGDPIELGKKIFASNGMYRSNIRNEKLVAELQEIANGQTTKQIEFYIVINEDNHFLKSEYNDLSNAKLRDLIKVSGEVADYNPTIEINSDGSLNLLFIPLYSFNNRITFKKLYGIEPTYVPLPKQGFGINGYAIYNMHNSAKLDMGKGVYSKKINAEAYENERIPYEAIHLKGNDGHIKPDIIEGDGELEPRIYKDDGSGSQTFHANDIRIGNGTFKYGGAIGYQFIYPLAVYYKIIDNGGIPVEYRNTLGSTIKTHSYKKENSKINYAFESTYSGYTFLSSHLLLDDGRIVQASNNKAISYEEGNGSKVEKIIGIYEKKDNVNITQAIIRADERDAEKFDTMQGIPTTEDLYVNVFGDEYLYNYDIKEVSGSIPYTVNLSKTYNLSWTETYTVTVTDYCSGTCKNADEDDKDKSCSGHKSKETRTRNYSDTQTVNKSYTINRSYSYYEIERLLIRGLKEAEVVNGALPGGKITIQASNYTAPVVDTWHSSNLHDHIIEPAQRSFHLGSVNYNGSSPPNENWRGKADALLEDIRVRNDKFIFNGATLLDNGYNNSVAPESGMIPKSPRVHKNVFYTDDLTIPRELHNNLYESSGHIRYTKIEDINTNSDKDLLVPINEINSVTVHTPVVSHPQEVYLYDDRDFNQQTHKYATDHVSLILGRSNEISYTIEGMHRSIPGYGEKDYTKYAKTKQIRCPFDVYLGNDRQGEFIPKNTWKDLVLGETNYKVYIPTWVDEGDYDIQFRTIAINANDLSLTQDHANLDSSNYVSTHKLPVSIVGRLYGFRITDINDYPDWQTVFRQNNKSKEHSGNYYYSGIADENGRILDNRAEQYTIPLVKGSHPEYPTLGPIKTGYKFNFELKAIGNYDGDRAGVYICPSFYFVDYNGGNRQEVDVYFNQKIDGIPNYFVKVGSEQDQALDYRIKMRLGDMYRNVPHEEVAATSQIHGISEDSFISKLSTIGRYYEVVLTKPVKTFVGDIADVPSSYVTEEKARRSMQKYYGQYLLPDEIYLTPKDLNIVEKSRNTGGITGDEHFWLDNGYLIVHFDISTFKNGEIRDSRLSYGDQSPYANMWEIERYISAKEDSQGNDFNFIPGDIVLYYSNKRATYDYKVGGTH